MSVGPLYFFLKKLPEIKIYKSYYLIDALLGVAFVEFENDPLIYSS